MILITGANGHFGKAAIDFLLKKIPAQNIAALVRDEAKATDLKAKGIEVRIGSYDDPASLKAALKGVDKVLLVSGTDIDNRLQQHKNVVDAALAEGVKQLVYTSVVRKNETASNPMGPLASTHVDTDAYIKASGLTYTILQNDLYADVLPMFFGEQVLASGIFLPAGKGKAAYATRQDLAEAAASTLTEEGHENKVYVLANTENYSLQDVANTLTELSGKTVAYTSPTIAEYTAVLTKAQVPAEYIGMFAAFSEAIRQGEFEVNRTDLEALLHRKPASLPAFLKAYYFATS